MAAYLRFLTGLLVYLEGTAQGILGAGISALTNSNGIMNDWVLLFFLSWIIIILGGLSLKFPQVSGLGLIIVSITAFHLGNVFSAPFAFLAGIFDLFSQSANNNNLINPTKNILKPKSGIFHQCLSV